MSWDLNKGSIPYVTNYSAVRADSLLLRLACI